MSMTRQQIRIAAAEARRNQWAGYTGPVVLFEDLDPGEVRVNRVPVGDGTVE